MSRTGGPAFPGARVEYGEVQGFSPGMSLRDWHATHCPITLEQAWGIWTKAEARGFETVAQAKERTPFLQWFAGFRYEYADAMLAESDQP